MKCKNCRNLVKRIDDDGTLYDFCGMVIDSPDTELERNCKYYVTATNADYIRSMSDEEFSHFLFGVQCAPASRPKEWLDWLKEEADDDCM